MCKTVARSGGTRGSAPPAPRVGSAVEGRGVHEKILYTVCRVPGDKRRVMESSERGRNA